MTDRPICGACRGSGMGLSPHEKCRACRGSGEGPLEFRPGYDYCENCGDEVLIEDMDDDLVCNSCREKERMKKEVERDAAREKG